MSDSRTYEAQYSESGFWGKLKRFAKKAGSEVVEKALWLFYAARRPETPGWAKTTIFAALGYFISPVDAVPDIVPFVGYSDDLAVLALAITAVSAYIDEDVKTKTCNKMKDWFG